MATLLEVSSAKGRRQRASDEEQVRKSPAERPGSNRNKADPRSSA